MRESRACDVQPRDGLDLMDWTELDWIGIEIRRALGDAAHRSTRRATSDRMKNARFRFLFFNGKSY